MKRNVKWFDQAQEAAIFGCSFIDPNGLLPQPLLHFRQCCRWRHWTLFMTVGELCWSVTVKLFGSCELWNGCVSHSSAKGNLFEKAKVQQQFDWTSSGNSLITLYWSKSTSFLLVSPIHHNLSNRSDFVNLRSCTQPVTQTCNLTKQLDKFPHRLKLTMVEPRQRSTGKYSQILSKKSRRSSGLPAPLHLLLHLSTRVMFLYFAKHFLCACFLQVNFC